MSIPVSRTDALASGAKRYFSGVPCLSGHIAERQTSNSTCVECSKVTRAKYKTSNLEKVLDRTRRWAAKNQEHVQAYRAANKQRASNNYRKRKAANPEKFLHESRAYREANRQACNERSRASMKKKEDYYKETSKARRASKPWIMKAATHRYRASKAQRTPAWADRDVIAAIFALAHKNGLSVDHIVPLRGKLVSGLHVENNLQLLPLPENVRKFNKFDPATFEMGQGLHPSVREACSAHPDVKVFI